LFLDSISTRDFSVANILIMFYGFMAIVGALLSDIILSIVDPRIRIKKGGWKMDNKDNNGRPSRQQEEENTEMMSVQERSRRRGGPDDRGTASDGRPRSGDPRDARSSDTHRYEKGDRDMSGKADIPHGASGHGALDSKNLPKSTPAWRILIQ